MPTNYKNGIIYKIVNNIDNMVYIGSTTSKLCYHMAVHRCNMRNNNSTNLYNHLRKLGIHNFIVVLIEAYPCQKKMQLLRCERCYFELYDKKTLLNSNRPYTSHIEKQQQVKTWYIDNKNYQINKAKNWYLNNKLHVKKRHLNNKLHFKIYMRKYNEHQKLMQELPFYRVPLIISF